MNTQEVQDFILNNFSAKVLNCSRAGIVAQSNINKKCGFFSLKGEQILPCIFDSIDNHLDGSVTLYYKGTEIFFTSLASNDDIKILFKGMFVLKTSNGNYKCHIRPSDRLYLNPSEYETVLNVTKDDNKEYCTAIAEELKRRLSIQNY